MHACFVIKDNKLKLCVTDTRLSEHYMEMNVHLFSVFVNSGIKTQIKHLAD